MTESIKNFAASNQLPSEASFTAEFIEISQNLLAFMNGPTQHGTDDKPYRCGVSNTSEHCRYGIS